MTIYFIRTYSNLYTKNFFFRDSVSCSCFVLFDVGFRNEMNWQLQQKSSENLVDTSYEKNQQQQINPKTNK